LAGELAPEAVAANFIALEKGVRDISAENGGRII